MRQGVRAAVWRLNEPADAAALSVFRFVFGFLLTWESYRFLTEGWIDEMFIAPAFSFKYYGLGWITAAPARVLYAAFVAMLVAAIAMAVSARYKLATSVVMAVFSYQFLLEKARYLNHFYAIILLLFLLLLVPYRHRRTRGEVPLWAYWIFRLQVGAIYFFAGVAKLDEDWLSGAAGYSLIGRRQEIPIVSFLSEYGLAQVVFGYGALALDALMAPLLMFRRTRAATFLLACMFHFANANLFSIGVFPWMMIGATTLFFSPAWPRQLLTHLGRPSYGRLHSQRFSSGPEYKSAVVLYCILQVVVPLRHHFIPGPVSWTEEGHRFSWRMMLRDKKGTAFYTVVADGRAYVLDPATILRPWQNAIMPGHPDMVVQMAQYVARRARAEGAQDVAVYADVMVSLNGRRRTRLIDSSVDLSRVRPRLFTAAPWITHDPDPVSLPCGRHSSACP